MATTSRKILSTSLVVGCLLALAPAASRAKRFVETHVLYSPPSQQAYALRLRTALELHVKPAVNRGGHVVVLSDSYLLRDWARLLGAAPVRARNVQRLNASVCEGVTVVAARSRSGASAHMRDLWDQLGLLGAREAEPFEDVHFMVYDDRRPGER